MYTSIGKILSVVVLNKNYDTLNSTGETEEFGILNSRYAAYKHLRSILKRQKIKLNIIFDFADEDKEIVDQAQKDFDSIKFIPINHKWGIDTQYVQDILVLIQKDVNSTIAITCYDKNKGDKLPEVITDFLKTAFSFCNSKEQLNIGKKHIEGGNILRGLYQNNDYAIIGKRTSNYYSSAELSNMLEIKEDSIFSFDLSKYLPSYKSITFHVDLYLMLGGPLKFKTYNNFEILFIGDAVGLPRQAVTDFNDAINNLWINEIKNCSIPFLPISLPILVIPGDYFLSYCNCHVENYLLTDNIQIINIYLPDYRITVKEIYKEKINNRNKQKESYTEKTEAQLDDKRNELFEFSDSLIMFSNYGNNSEFNNNEFESQNNNDPTVRMIELHQDNIDFRIDQAIENIQNYISNTLRKIGVDNVYFVSGNYHEMGRDSRGSLHCMSLVTKRGPHGFD
jgi:hypothetical protein